LGTARKPISTSIAKSPLFNWWAVLVSNQRPPACKNQTELLHRVSPSALEIHFINSHKGFINHRLSLSIKTCNRHLAPMWHQDGTNSRTRVAEHKKGRRLPSPSRLSHYILSISLKSNIYVSGRVGPRFRAADLLPTPLTIVCSVTNVTA
jgi:hypothetical protein